MKDFELTEQEKEVLSQLPEHINTVPYQKMVLFFGKKFIHDKVNEINKRLGGRTIPPKHSQQYSISVFFNVFVENISNKMISMEGTECFFGGKKLFTFVPNSTWADYPVCLHSIASTELLNKSIGRSDFNTFLK